MVCPKQPLELSRWSVSQGRVESFFVIHLLDELADAPPRVGEVVILEQVYFLVL
jgi:hypothetical protein